MARTIKPFDPKDLAAHPERFFRREYVWQLPVRITHWVTAASLMTLFATGLYIASPLFSPIGEPAHHFLMGRVRQVHFAAAMIFLFSFLLRICWFWLGNNYARSGVPMIWRTSWWRDLFTQAADYLKLDRGHVHLGHNALGGAVYSFFVVFLGWVQIFTGLAMYSETNPGGFLNRWFGWVLPMLGGSFHTRMIHHLVAWAFPIFAMLHIYIVIYDSTQYGNGLINSIVSGHKFYQEGDIQDDTWLG
jgi:Ni/Fe-hydrogenase 1 B-type cytochrome subunit